MGDGYTSFARSGLGKVLVKRLGLPDPPPLKRYQQGDVLIPGSVLLGPADSPLHTDLDAMLGLFAAPPLVEGNDDTLGKYHGLLYDGTGLHEPEQLRELFDFFHPLARRVQSCGRVVVLGTTETSAAQQALDGFVRSLGKEFGKGITAQLVRLHPHATVAAARSTLEWLFSAKSAYVSGQTIVVGPEREIVATKKPVVLVTGAARGIGEAMARVFARDGAHVLCLDVPQAGEDLAKVANEVRGEAIQLDLTTPEAAERLVNYVKFRHSKVDVIVHNAGITRDKTLANMDESRWDDVLGVNLIAPMRVTDALLAEQLIPPGGRIIGVASIAGIAGNRGQTNYAASKAGIIGWVRSLAPQLADQGITVNAVAPGFIETNMTSKVPMLTREAGRRMNSLAQGGLPIDVAETVAWLAAPGAAAVTGNVVRVCGQMLLGA